MKPLLAVCLVLFGTSVALADDTDVERLAEAERLLAEGIAAFEQERLADALSAHRKAWELEKTYKTAGGLGQVELHLGHYRDAAEHLFYCLMHFPTDGGGEARAQIEAGLARARAEVSAFRIRVDQDGAVVEVDGAEVGRAPLDALVFVEPGSRRVSAAAEGGGHAEQEVMAIKGGSRQIFLEVSEPPSARDAPVDAAPVPDAAPEPSSGGLHAGVWTIIVGGALTVGAGVSALVFDAKGASAQDDLDELARAVGDEGGCVDPTPDVAANCAALEDATSDRNRSNRIATFSAIGAGVVAAGTIVTAILLWPPDDETSARLQVAAAPGSVFVMGRF